MDLKAFNFSAEIQQAIRYNKWTNLSVDQKVKPPQIVDKRNNPIPSHQFKLNHQFSNLLEFENHLYYFFLSDISAKSKQEDRKQFNMTLYLFKKKDGKSQKITIEEFKGVPNCIATGISINLSQKHGNTEKMTEQSEKAATKNKIIAIIGLKDGIIKVVEFSLQAPEKINTIVNSHKLQQKEIVSVIIPGMEYFDTKSICLVLIQDSKVFVFNYLSKQVLAIYQSPIMAHDYALSMSFHKSGKYIATCTKLGLMIFWELGESTLKVIDKSEEKMLKIKKVAEDKGDKSDKRDKGDMSQEQMQVSEYVWSFNRKQRVISVFPMYMLHSASIDGLKWFDFMGNLLAFITRKGLFRLITINFQVRDEFIIILQHQINKGQSISSVQMYPQSQCFYVTKARQFIKVIQNQEEKTNLKEHQQLKWKENMLKSKDHSVNYRMNYRGIEPYKQEESTLQKYVISDDKELRISKITMLKLLNAQSNKPIHFKETILNHNQKFLLARTNEQFYISLLQEEEQIQRTI